ncbi:hypothetical protein RFI_22191 [Reticulomyxa filosa]|uniref:Uncharacterized protein n=1 Tax=Reticulomyxa filosa TaxID=46433 RepID=X6MMD2_RETFI|nr:hypothetical protein RFI_22191 [Reticulomyxa filosa]|eukprot:ETO15173.1 hypothetical protein RFI_22191 [Reticulomyxa filosa]
MYSENINEIFFLSKAQQIAVEHQFKNNKIQFAKFLTKRKNKEINEKIYTNKTLEAKKDNENEELNTTKEKLKQHYQPQDKLAPLFDDPEQSIDTCYIQLALLTQQQKDKLINNQEKQKSEENGKYKGYKEENGKWKNSLNYSLICGNQTENIELQVNQKYTILIFEEKKGVEKVYCFKGLHTYGEIKISNGLNSKLNENKIFNMFEMEMDYLSQIGWEGLKCGQPIISCETQQRILNMIKIYQ